MFEYDYVPAEPTGGVIQLTIVADGDDYQRAAALAASDGIRIVQCTSVATAPMGVPVLLIGDGEQPERIDFALPSAVDDDKLRKLIRALATDAPHVAAPLPHIPTSTESARLYNSVFLASRQIVCSTDLVSAEWAIVTAIYDLLGVEHAYCYFYSSAQHSLWSEIAGTELQASRGLVGWAARTGISVDVELASSEPLWHAQLDAPKGSKRSQLLVQPVLCRGGNVQAVLVAERSNGIPFSPRDRAAILQLSCACGPFLEELSAQVAGENVLEADAQDSLFREEARQSSNAYGPVLQLRTRWVRSAFYAAVVATVIAIVALASIRLPQYVQGRAIVRNVAVLPLTSSIAGTVSSLEVRPGDNVDSGTILLRLSAPVDAGGNNSPQPTAGASYGVEAPARGAVEKLLVRPGDRVEKGDIIGFLNGVTTRPEATVLVPAIPAGILKPGMDIRVDLPDHRDNTFTIKDVWPSPLDIADVRELVGDSLLEIPPRTTVVTAYARESDASPRLLGADKQEYVGRAYVPVRSQSVLNMLISRGTRQ